ncbi:RNA pseudouridine synthase [Bacteroidia bacterium]|nr:RNA pseudouridine synthase [Bacteroidia bacterium]
MAKRNNIKDWIILETEDYVFINKPAGISSLKERGNQNSDDILSLARLYQADMKLCHRLDKYTSGVMLLAKNEEALRSASIQFQRKEVGKLYHTLTQGSSKLDNEIVELPILIDEKRRTVRINKNLGKKSKTSFRTLQSFKGYSLIECTLFSGRMHQIRIHLSSIGHPIIGDGLYGGKLLRLSQIKHKYNYNRTGEEQPIIKRFALHSFELTLKDLDGKEVCVKADYPKDFNVLLQALTKNSA